MAEIKAKKASEEFANDSFESIDGTHTRARKWSELADKLNSLGGAIKDGPKKRKFWLVQKIHVKERDALLKVAFERSGLNGPKNIKPLTDFEKRVFQFMVPAVVHGNEEVEELFNTADSIATGQMFEEWLLEETPAGESSEKPPPVAVQPTNVMAPRKRQWQPSGKKLSMEEKLVKIEEEKLLYTYKKEVNILIGDFIDNVCNFMYALAHRRLRHARHKILPNRLLKTFRSKKTPCR